MDHLDQLAFVREQVPMSVAAGEDGYDPWYFRDMLQAGAVDVLQTDATRCLGVAGTRARLTCMWRRSGENDAALTSAHGVLFGIGFPDVSSCA